GGIDPPTAPPAPPQLTDPPNAREPLVAPAEGDVLAPTPSLPVEKTETTAGKAAIITGSALLGLCGAVTIAMIICFATVDPIVGAIIATPAALLLIAGLIVLLIGLYRRSRALDAAQVPVDQ